jgi:hypothetical protein
VATLAAIRDAIKTTLTDNISGLRLHDTIPDEITPPCVVVAPVSADFNVAMGRGFDTWQFDLLIFLSRSDPRSAQDSLDGYVNGFGASSIRKVIFSNRTLGLTGVDAHVSGMSNYSARHLVGTTEYFGASLRLVVHTPGTE